jgi:hypothetical protein
MCDTDNISESSWELIIACKCGSPAPDGVTADFMCQDCKDSASAEKPQPLTKLDVKMWCTNCRALIDKAGNIIDDHNKRLIVQKTPARLFTHTDRCRACEGK